MNLINFREFLKFLRCLGSQFKQLHYSTICFSPKEITTQQAFYTLISFPTFLAFILPFFSILCGSSERTYIIYGSEPFLREERALTFCCCMTTVCNPCALQLPTICGQTFLKACLLFPVQFFFPVLTKYYFTAFPREYRKWLLLLPCIAGTMHFKHINFNIKFKSSWKYQIL